MVTDEMLDAIDMMIEICGNEEQAKGMRAVAEMLGDFEEGSWLCTENPSDCQEWLGKYLPCHKRSV